MAEQTPGGPTDGMPPAPPPLLEAIVGLRELFTTYMEAGFSEYQTCVILGTMMAQSGQNGAGGESGA